MGIRTFSTKWGCAKVGDEKNEIIENKSIDSELSLHNLNQEIESLNERLNSLQHFIEISEKFLSINK